MKVSQIPMSELNSHHAHVLVKITENNIETNSISMHILDIINKYKSQIKIDFHQFIYLFSIFKNFFLHTALKSLEKNISYSAKLSLGTKRP